MNEIEKYRHDIEIATAAARQLEKDFAMSGYELHLTDGNYDALMAQLQTIVKGIYSNNHQMFMALLYRMDIEPAQIAEAENKYSGSSFFHELTAIILDKVIIKVVLRKLYGRSVG